jgi:hypothetical protein
MVRWTCSASSLALLVFGVVAECRYSRFALMQVEAMCCQKI